MKQRNKTPRTRDLAREKTSKDLEVPFGCPDMRFSKLLQLFGSKTPSFLFQVINIVMGFTKDLWAFGVTLDDDSLGFLAGKSHSSRLLLSLHLKPCAKVPLASYSEKARLVFCTLGASWTKQRARWWESESEGGGIMLEGDDLISFFPLILLKMDVDRFMFIRVFWCA